MDKKKAAAPKIQNVEGPDGVMNIYANSARLEWTLYDVRMRFGQLLFVGNPEERRMIVEERVAVTVAWAEAKYLRDLLADLINKYERVNGEISALALAPTE
jgi:Protein of unknown function (DUF3467)